ncbi:glycosyltransferase family 4 protein [Planctomycetota bacterium]|nr:glycosyltransferase family 4 protein [Planctomycetota bacterium]
MKVAYYSNQFVASRGHGITRYSRSLFRALRATQSSLDVVPVTSWSPKSIEGFEALREDTGIEVLPWGRRVTPLAWTLLGAPAIDRWLTSGFDLLHVLALGYPVPSRLPWVVTIHDIGPLTHPQYFPKSNTVMMKHGLRQAARSASAMICVSKSTAEEVEDYLGPSVADRLHVVGEGVTRKARMNPNGPDEALVDGVPAGVPFLLAAGGASPRKNLARLLSAFEGLAARIPHHLVLVGGASWGRCDLQERIEASPFKDRIHRLGYVTDERLDALFGAAAAFVHVSLFEGFGLPLLEAMEARCPVVTSSISSLPEVAGDAAVLVDPHDVDAISEGIFQVATNAHLAGELVAKGETRVDEFTWESCASQVANIYRGIAAS